LHKPVPSVHLHVMGVLELHWSILIVAMET
jgi:hypothetical protein